MARNQKVILLAAAVVLVVSCATRPAPRGLGTTEGKTSAAAPSSPMTADADLKARLDRIIARRLDGQQAAKILGSFRIDGYDIQDKETYWGHRTVGGGGSPFSEYYLTYRNRYVIMLLKDGGDLHTCLDVKVMERTSPEYEMTTGRVQVDGAMDEEVIVVFNRNWNGDSTSDVTAAFKANVETGRIKEVNYQAIRVYREE